MEKPSRGSTEILKVAVNGEPTRNNDIPNCSARWWNVDTSYNHHGSRSQNLKTEQGTMLEKESKQNQFEGEAGDWYFVRKKLKACPKAGHHILGTNTWGTSKTLGPEFLISGWLCFIMSIMLERVKPYRSLNIVTLRRTFKRGNRSQIAVHTRCTATRGQ